MITAKPVSAIRASTATISIDVRSRNPFIVRFHRREEGRSSTGLSKPFRWLANGHSGLGRKCVSHFQLAGSATQRGLRYAGVYKCRG